MKRIDRVYQRLSSFEESTEKQSQVRPSIDDEIQEKIEKHRDELERHLSNDLNTPLALKSYFEIISLLEKTVLNGFPSSSLLAGFALRTLKELDAVFGIFYHLPEDHYLHQQRASSISMKEEQEEKEKEVLRLAEERHQLKRDKKFREADLLREKILQLGYRIHDTKYTFTLECIE